LDWEGRPFVGAELVLRADEGYGAASGTPDAADGSFRLGPVAPGAWHIHFSSDRLGTVWLPPFDLAADETKDVGVIQLERPGTFELTLSRKDGAQLESSLIMLCEPKNRGHGLKSEDGRLFRSEPLLPGTYRLRNYLRQARMLEQDVVIAAGEVTRLELVLETGVARQLLCTLPDGVPIPPTFFARVLDAEGKEVAKHDGDPPTTEKGPLLVLVATVPAGRYTYECRAGTEWEGSGSFEVLDLEQAYALIPVPLTSKR
jgi:hypothetical protein